MLIGQQIGPFVIQRELGSGAMGTVYKALFHKDDKVIEVALKVVSFGLADNDTAMARFEREGMILRQMKHPHIVRFFATGRHKKTRFIAMEYVEGKSLDRVLADRGRLNWEDVVNYGKQLCQALQHAHEKGIVHRDLKPSNLMVTPEGVLKLTDFGIAKDTDVTALTGANSTIGTAAYMSPEQCRGDKTIGAKSDLYSLGVVFYELLTGKKPFTAETTVEMFMKHVQEKPIPPSRHVPDLPSWLNNLVMFLLEKDREIRPLDAATVERMLTDIEQKVAAQQSLGAEVANAARTDRNAPNQPLNQADKETARLLKTTTKKKKKKKAKSAGYGKLIQAGAIILALAGLAGLSWYLLKPEGIDAAHARLQAAQSPSDKLEQVTQFLSAHGSKSDPRVTQARELLGELRVRDAEEKITKRYNSKLKGNSEGFDDDAYKLVIQAMDAEKAGNLKQAEDLYVAIRVKLPPGDPSTLANEDQAGPIILGWVADKRIKELQVKVPELGRKLVKDLNDDRELDRQRNLESGQPETLAVKATRLKHFGDKAKSVTLWDALTTQTERDLDQRLWYLLSRQQFTELGGDKAKTEEKTAQAQRVEVQVQKIEIAYAAIKNDPDNRVARRDLRGECRNVIAMYDDESADAMKALTQRVKVVLDAVTK